MIYIFKDEKIRFNWCGIFPTESFVASSIEEEKDT